MSDKDPHSGIYGILKTSNKITAPKMNPCLFCGSASKIHFVKIISVQGEANMYKVICSNTLKCSFSGPNNYTKENACAEWNRITLRKESK